MRAVNPIREITIKGSIPRLIRSRTAPIYLAIIVSASQAAVAISHGGPVAVPDVSVYLSFSQWLYGGLQPTEPAFFPGYGLLLAPVGWMSGSDLHTAALLLNSAAAGACVILAARLARMLGATPRVEMMAAVLTAVHPSLSSSSRIGWPETLLSLSVLVICLAVQKKRWDWVGMVGGLSLALHPRLIVVVIAMVLVALIHKQMVTLAKGLLPGLLATVIMLQWTDSWPTDRLSAAQSIGDGPSPLLTAAGQWMSLSAGTACLASIGLVVAVCQIRRSRAPALETFLVLSVGAMLVLGGWVLAGSERIDTLLYGRYIDPWSIPLTVLGLTALSRRRVPFKLVAGTAASVIVAFLVAVSGATTVAAPPRRIMTLSLGSVWSTVDKSLIPVLVVAAIVSLVAIATMMRGPWAAVVLLIILSLTSTVSNHRHLNEVGKIADGQVTVAAFLPEEINCLSHDDSAKSYAIWLYRLQLPEMRHNRVHLAANETPCGGYVIADAKALTTCAEAKLLAEEPRGSWGLWKYPTQGCP